LLLHGVGAEPGGLLWGRRATKEIAAAAIDKKSVHTRLDFFVAFGVNATEMP
jgi:hypothetical protein